MRDIGKMKQTRGGRLLLLFTFLCLIKAGPAKADLFDSSGYDKCKNDKLACELQLKYCRKKNKTLKENARGMEECRGGKAEAEKKLDQQMAEINELKAVSKRFKRKHENEKTIAENNIRELEQAINILRQESLVQEKDLTEEKTQLDKQHKSELEKATKKLKTERNNHILEIGALRKDYESKIAGMSKKASQMAASIKNKNKKIASLKRKIKKLSAPPPELKLLDVQEKKLADTLKKEIKAGQASLVRLKNKLAVKIHSRFSFASGSAKLKKDIFPALDKIGQVLVAYPQNTVMIEGHTDNDKLVSRIYRDNWELSAKRALAVLRRILKNSALDKSKFAAVGRGRHRPLAPNDSSKNKSFNRRVEIVITPF